MIVNVSYPLAALHEAARFIWENNTSVKNWPSQPENIFDVMKDIQEMMRQGALSNAKVILKEKKLKVNFDNEWIGFTGTGGYYISYESINFDEEEINIGATILVDPAVSALHPGYVTEFVDNIVEEV